ncbi:hypothetical protein [Actinokineospora cianjurensis]|uniref:Uncharacterized protein n=1 Tax=Actinokineospora cianjurensis TaxID=585224 RepID=A0A421AX85_9PSEU|nr:hypothetical protein [Actinokineospora cianjurensis]RLK54440.1 hypothetical protein CLV68_5992 [Actinokineospora cianjurensis]
MSSSEKGPAVSGTEPRVIDAIHGLREEPKRVWVDLGRLCPVLPGQPARVNELGVHMTGLVPGQLTRWVPVYRGGWMAVVSFKLQYADGRRDEPWLRDQLVHASAVLQRDTD